MKEIMITNLVFPILMILVGHFFSFFKQPKGFFSFGYRSFMSMKNDETWEYAQILASKAFIINGIFNLIIVIFSPPISLILFQLLTFMLTMIIIEGRLYRLFDLHGKRKY